MNFYFNVAFPFAIRLRGTHVIKVEFLKRCCLSARFFPPAFPTLLTSRDDQIIFSLSHRSTETTICPIFNLSQDESVWQAVAHGQPVSPHHSCRGSATASASSTPRRRGSRGWDSMGVASASAARRQDVGGRWRGRSQAPPPLPPASWLVSAQAAEPKPRPCRSARRQQRASKPDPCDANDGRSDSQHDQRPPSGLPVGFDPPSPTTTGPWLIRQRAAVPL